MNTKAFVGLLLFFVFAFGFVYFHMWASQGNCSNAPHPVWCQ